MEICVITSDQPSCSCGGLGFLFCFLKNNPTYVPIVLISDKNSKGRGKKSLGIPEGKTKALNISFCVFCPKMPLYLRPQNCFGKFLKSR